MFSKNNFQALIEHLKENKLNKLEIELKNLEQLKSLVELMCTNQSTLTELILIFQPKEEESSLFVEEIRKLIEKTEKLNKFKLIYRLKKEDILALKQSIITNKSLQSLSMYFNDLSDKDTGAKELFEALNGNSSITSLEFNFSFLSEKNHLLFSQFLSNNQKIKNLK